MNPTHLVYSALAFNLSVISFELGNLPGTLMDKLVGYSVATLCLLVSISGFYTAFKN